MNHAKTTTTKPSVRPRRTIMLGNQSPSPNVEPEVISAFRSECLTAHNNFRKQHAVPPLTWSDELATGAQGWADRLADKGYMQYSENPGWGENISVLNLSNKDEMIDGNSVTSGWYAEVRSFDFERPRWSKSTFHFSQVLWKNSAEFGCGVAKCPSNSRTPRAFAVAFYRPAGNNNFRNEYQNNVPPPLVPLEDLSISSPPPPAEFSDQPQQQQTTTTTTQEAPVAGNSNKGSPARLSISSNTSWRIKQQMEKEKAAEEESPTGSLIIQNTTTTTTTAAVNNISDECVDDSDDVDNVRDLNSNPSPSPDHSIKSKSSVISNQQQPPPVATSNSPAKRSLDNETPEIADIITG